MTFFQSKLRVMPKSFSALGVERVCSMSVRDCRPEDFVCLKIGGYPRLHPFWIVLYSSNLKRLFSLSFSISVVLWLAPDVFVS
jgi:hypothetical protein